MPDHFHTGTVAFLFAGISALIFLNLWKIACAHLADSDNATIATIGTSAGALVHFGAGG